ncbi:MAG: hypothetical protein LJE64_09155 [Desulfofustis sp.]|nr:hypothetical protein [Desulfofustis sp.]
MNDILAPPAPTSGASGFCRRCRATHRLPPAGAEREACQLMERLERSGSIALWPEHLDLPALSTDPLFGDSRGKMFGVLEALDRHRQTHFLYAFSGQYNGLWQVPGWAPPLFDVERFQRFNGPQEAHIKALTRRIEQENEATAIARLKAERTGRCRRLMNAIHGLYVLNNARGDTATLDEVLGTDRGKPTGIGDCCAPKLLNHAAVIGLRPVSLVEFYFGRCNRSQSKHHKRFYPPCTDKCEPLLGFLLCGT